MNLIEPNKLNETFVQTNKTAWQGRMPKANNPEVFPSMTVLQKPKQDEEVKKYNA